MHRVPSARGSVGSAVSIGCGGDEQAKILLLQWLAVPTALDVGLFHFAGNAVWVTATCFIPPVFRSFFNKHHCDLKIDSAVTYTVWLDTAVCTAPCQSWIAFNAKCTYVLSTPEICVSRHL